MRTSKTLVHLGAAVALLLMMDAYTIREIRNLRAEIAGAERSLLAEAPKPRPAEPAVIARAYSIGSAETRNFPGR
ncbi:MAG TPA: hypothetical protein VN893_13245 [Bryobacteraceae bacterium]|nr:hypothetical protein [Bryobacteraceae bacterium]